MKQGDWQGGGGCSVVVVIAMDVAVGVVWRTTDAKHAPCTGRGVCAVELRARCLSFFLFFQFWSFGVDASIRTDPCAARLPLSPAPLVTRVVPLPPLQIDDAASLPPPLVDETK